MTSSPREIMLQSTAKNHHNIKIVFLLLSTIFSFMNSSRVTGRIISVSSSKRGILRYHCKNANNCSTSHGNVVLSAFLTSPSFVSRNISVLTRPKIVGRASGLFLDSAGGSFGIQQPSHTFFHFSPRQTRSQSQYRTQQFFSSGKSSNEVKGDNPKAQQQPSQDDEPEYDWDVLLPFQKHSHNSIKITIPDEEPTSDDPFHIDTFQTKLQTTLETARTLQKNALWLTVPLSRSALLPFAHALGLRYHHAQNTTATLVLWLHPHQPSRIPEYATHQVGVGAVVIHPPSNKILCVREKRNNYRPWKMPGGLVELGEELDEAVVREVWEETGVKTRFRSVLGVRHTHGMQFGRSDLYFVCRLEPVLEEEGRDGEHKLPTPIAQEGEIEKAAWVDLDEYRDMVNHEEKGRGHPMMSQIMKIVDQTDWEERDIQRTLVESVVPGRKASPVYHAAIRSED
mmetsp:Transcript_12527/g.25007  ORF Transcript_12527/g.25007 Transcript_12527/m.25007 type:complete len:454 (+) Transcript_12527:134-1495(+)